MKMQRGPLSTRETRMYVVGEGEEEKEEEGKGEGRGIGRGQAQARARARAQAQGEGPGALRWEVGKVAMKTSRGSFSDMISCHQ